MPNLEGRMKTLLSSLLSPWWCLLFWFWFLFTTSTLHGKNTWPGGWSGPVRGGGDPPHYAQVCFSGVLFIIWLKRFVLFSIVQALTFCLIKDNILSIDLAFSPPKKMEMTLSLIFKK